MPYRQQWCVGIYGFWNDWKQDDTDWAKEEPENPVPLPPSSSVWWSLEFSPSSSTAAGSAEIEGGQRAGKHNYLG